MFKHVPLNFFSRILILVMLVVMSNGAHESAHAMQNHEAAANELVSQPELSESHECPCAPLEQHNDCDGCDKCVNCNCHAPLTVRPFQICYNPIILDLGKFHQFSFLPEVYLSLFVPPDSATV